MNFAPADVRKEGSGYDLPLAVGLLIADGLTVRRPLENIMLVGELGLDGSVRPVRGALPVAIKARELEYDMLIVPKANVREAAVVNRVKVYGADTLKEVMDFLMGDDRLQPTEVDTRQDN